MRGEMEKYKFDDFNKEEVSLIKQEITRRIKNLIFMAAENQTSEIINKMVGMSFNGEDTIDIKFSTVFVFNDILEIVGGLRRK